MQNFKQERNLLDLAFRKLLVREASVLKSERRVGGGSWPLKTPMHGDRVLLSRG